MDRFVLSDKRKIVVFICFLFGAVILSMFRVDVIGLHNIGAFIYCGLIIAWTLTIRKRIVDAKIRTRFLIAGILMLILMLLRICRFTLVPADTLASDMVWFSYYIPFIGIPLCGLSASLYISSKEKRKLDIALMATAAVLCIGVLTNPLHKLCFVYEGSYSGNEYSRGPLYYVFLATVMLFWALMFVILVIGAKQTASRKLRYIPVLACIPCLILLLWYLAEGGAPVRSGIKLFQLQEVYCIMFVAFSDSLIRTGLIPSNTGYEKIFDHSTLNAKIVNKKGEVKLSSHADNGGNENGDTKTGKAGISGGYVIWSDDLSAVKKLQMELFRLTDSLELENDIIRKENAVRSEKISIEAKNRLYDKIAKRLSPQIKEVTRLLSDDNEATFRKSLTRATVLGAFIKRMGNLILLSDTNRELMSDELSYSIGESLEYIKLTGVDCDLNDGYSCRLPAGFLKDCYDVFEKVIESSLDDISSCLITFRDMDGFEFTMATDAAEGKINELFKSDPSVRVFEEDDILYIRLRSEVIS